MANLQLFEKYGIKEVADVTFYRIEKKTETYESQREISMASIIKGSVALKTVFPMVNGVGSDEGFEAYVFTDATILSYTNYECDDIAEVANEVTYSIASADWEGDSDPTVKDIVKPENIKTGTVPPKYIDMIEGEVQDELDAFTVTVKYIITPAQGGDDPTKGTHEYSYEEQMLMLFAKNQNLITKTGTRYNFKETGLFGELTFDDNFAASANSTERVVVLGLVNNFDSGSYIADDVLSAIRQLTTTFKAKAYDIVYKDYAELIVEDEMGYFNPNFLGLSYNKVDGSIGSPYKESTTITKDLVIANAEQWVAHQNCLSINDAIEALRKKKIALDTNEEAYSNGVGEVTGGYGITSGLGINEDDSTGQYTYTPDGLTKSGYSLASVLDALSQLSNIDEAVGKAITVDASTSTSNRAIYVKGDVLDLAASAYIYLLRNVNYKKLALDKTGVFTFVDREGNTVYYRDTIFAGTEYLALVVIGTSGLIFKVNRHGSKKIEKIAWLVNENGYITNDQAEKIVQNGLIHITDIELNDESFEATCSVCSLKLRKTEKTVNRYVPVLFLDTLKVSTLEQTAEQTAATGGKGNAQLIIWDYGKEITLSLEDALYSPASMSAMLGAYEGNDFTKGVKDTKKIDRTEKCIAKRSFIVPAGNSKGVPSEGDNTPQAVYIDLSTMQPYQDGAPIAEGEVYLKWTRSMAYGDNSIGKTIEISAEKFPGTYKVVGDTYARNKTTGEDQRFQFVIPQAKMTSEQTITLEAEGDPTVFSLSMTVLRPDDGNMLKLIQYDVVENTEENDGSTMIKGTENLNLLDDAEMFKVGSVDTEDEVFIGATEY